MLSYSYVSSHFCRQNSVWLHENIFACFKIAYVASIVKRRKWKINQQNSICLRDLCFILFFLTFSGTDLEKSWGKNLFCLYITVLHQSQCWGIFNKLPHLGRGVSWWHPLQTKIVELWGRDRRCHWLFMIAWVFFLPWSHYDDSFFIVCFIWYNFIWGVSPNFYRIYLLQKLCLNLRGPVPSIFVRMAVAQ